MPPERYVLIRDGAVLWGPGPKPYFINLPNGDLFEVAAHTAEERAAAGLVPVEQRGWHEIDPQIEQAETPVFALENGRPLETWSYLFTPGAREAMLRKIDDQAEMLRGEFFSGAPGQAMEYEAVSREAQAVGALPLEEAIAPERFPFLEADIGVTDLPGAGRKVETVREAAAVVHGARILWHQAGAQIRAKRLSAKAQVILAATDADAYRAYRDAWVAGPAI